MGTAAHGTKAATQYIINPTGGENEVWFPLTFPADASILRQTEPIVLGGVESDNREDGMVSLFKDFSTGERGRCVGQVSAPRGGYSRSFEFKASKLGDLRGVFSLLNPWG